MDTEKEMREAKVPTFETREELNSYITSLLEQKHDYGTSVYAVSMAATATFNYMARALGITGFQASCADLDVIKRTRYIKGPFAIITADAMLYRQEGLISKVAELEKQWKPWAKEEAVKLLLEDDRDYPAHPEVIKHWLKLAHED